MDKALGLLGFALLLGGCLTSSDPGPQPDPLGVPPEAAAAVDPWGGTDRQHLVGVHALTTELDVLCLLGGGSSFVRGDGRVLEGTSVIEVQVRVDPTYTGMQIGYSIDDGEVTWLPLVSNGEEVQTIAVSAVQAEQPNGTQRWVFHHQMNLPAPATQGCYTGGGTGSWEVVIAAVRAPVSGEAA